MGCDFSTLFTPEPSERINLTTPVDASNHYKVILVGDISVGKSSLVQRLLGKGFREEHVSTIGTAFASVNMVIKENEPPIALHVWDTAGEERYRSMSRFFFRGTNVGILVFDVQAPESLKRLRSWFEDIEKAAPESRFIVVANKIDCSDPARQISREEGEGFASEIGAKYTETSAKTEEGVLEMFQIAARICAEGPHPIAS